MTPKMRKMKWRHFLYQSDFMNYKVFKRKKHGEDDTKPKEK